MRRPKYRGDRRLLSLPNLKRNERQQMDGVELLEQLPKNIVDCFFFDPQYRNVLDQMKFGNEGARQQGRAKLPQMTDDTIGFFLEELARVSRPSAHGFLWMDKFCVATGVFRKWLRRTPFEVVDLLAWNKMRPGMGRRLRCVTEYCVVLQKPPTRAKDIWTDHSIRDAWNEFSDRDIHAHCKPYALTERLIRATTKAGDLVVDPCAGGYGVLEACLATGREFLGSDLIAS